MDGPEESHRLKYCRQVLAGGAHLSPKGHQPHLASRASQKNAPPKARSYSDYDNLELQVQKGVRQFGDNDLQTRIDSNSRASKTEPQSKRGRQERFAPPPPGSPPLDASSREGTTKHRRGSTPSPRHSPPGDFAEVGAHGFSVDKTSFEEGDTSCSSFATSESGRGKICCVDSGQGDSERDENDMSASCWDARGVSRDRRPFSDISRPRWQACKRRDVIDSGDGDVLSGAKRVARREGWGEERRYGTDASSTGCHPKSRSHDRERRHSFRDRGEKRSAGGCASSDDSRDKRNDAWSEGESMRGRGDALARLDRDDKDDGSGGHRRWHISRRSFFHQSFLNIGKGRRFAEAWGSETTATPSPRAPGCGSVVNIGGDVTDGGIVWLGGPTDAMVTISRRRGLRAEKRRSRVCPSNLEVCHGSSMSSSLVSAITKAPREGGRLRGGSAGFRDSEAGAKAAPEADEYDVCVSGRESNGFDRTADLRNRRAGEEAGLLLPSSGGAGRGEETVGRRNRRGRQTSLVVPNMLRCYGQGGNEKIESNPADKTTINLRGGHQREKRLSYSAWGQSGDRGSKDGGRSVHRPDVDETSVNLSKCRGVQVQRNERTSDRCLEGFSSDEASNSWQQRLEWKMPDNRGNGGDGRGRTRESTESETGAIVGLLRESKPSRINNFLMMSYDRGTNSDMVQCIVMRDRSGPNRFYPRYSFFFDGHEGQLVMMAHKCRKNRTSSYQVFDMQRGGFEQNCSSIMVCCSTAQRLRKTSENYLGKVRTNLKRTETTIFTNDQKAAELGAISFERPGLVDYLREGSQPRNFFVLLPALDTEGVPVSHKVDPFDADSDLAIYQLSRIRRGRYGGMFPLKTREPTFMRGNYRLNFHGRVTVPSAKNVQLVSPDDKTHTVYQFGKVGKDRFHLDYRSPINAFQAFCISLAQFNY